MLWGQTQIPPPPRHTDTVGTTSQGRGKGSGEGKMGPGGRGRTLGGERPMGTTADGGRGSKGRAANGDRPIGAAGCRREQHTKGNMPTPRPPLGVQWGCTRSSNTGVVTSVPAWPVSLRIASTSSPTNPATAAAAVVHAPLAADVALAALSPPSAPRLCGGRAFGGGPPLVTAVRA